MPPTAPPTVLPTRSRRLMLRPGLSLVRRDDGHVQVGLDAPDRVVLPDTEAVRLLLDELPGVPQVRTDTAAAALGDLLACGLLVDADELAARRREVGRAVSEAVYAAHGPTAGARLTARAAARVSLVPHGDVDLAPLRRLLADAGLTVHPEAPEAPELAGPPEAPAIWVVLSRGPAPRALVDDLLRDGVAHLLVESAAGRVRLGPLVEPGVTACVRCVDAHLAEADPRRPLVVEQLSSDDRSGQAPDPVLHALALAWAANDVAGLVDASTCGPSPATPATWSSTVDLAPGAVPVVRAWERHPHCGCAWDTLPY